MKKLILAAVVAVLAATAVSATPRFGGTTKYNVGQGSRPAVGIALEEEMFNATLTISNDKVTNVSFQSNQETTDFGLTVAGNYKHQLGGGNTLLAGLGFTSTKNTTDLTGTASDVELTSTGIEVNVGVQKELSDNVLLTVESPLVGIWTTKSDQANTEDQKSTKIIDGVKVGFTFLIN